MDKKKRLLIIDDEPLIRSTLSDYLTECGYETATARDGAEGLKAARAQEFDAVLVDLRMPNVDGLEVIDELQAEQPNLPLVVVSGTGVLADAVEAVRRGADDYITKPVHDMEEIELIIERVLDKARLRAERDLYQVEIEDLNRLLEAKLELQTKEVWLQNRRLSALNKVSHALGSDLDLDTMLNRAIDAAVSAIDADGGVVRLLNPRTRKLVISASRGLPEHYLESAQAIPLGEGIMGRVAQDGHVLAGQDFASDPWVSPLAEEMGLQSYICVPLRAGDQSDASRAVLGTLGVVVGAQREFDAYDIELLTAIGSQIGVYVARSQYAADLRQAVAQLERANAELRALSTLREQFIQNVSHELRTPLALVRGYIEMLAEGDLDEEEREMALGVASRRVETLVSLVEDISTLQDLSTAPITIKEMSPQELVETVVKMAAQRASGTNVELRVVERETAPSMPGDFTRLVQALHQLVDNACKFSPEGGTVTIATSVSGNWISLDVSDQGIGIPSSEHERIFERFYQVDGSMTRRFGGTGLGLALVKEVAEAHGGSVGVESEEGQGSTFSLWLPLQ
jgi:signal transduction histidine kinase